MSWLTSEFHKLGNFAGTTWDHNRNFVGNLAKNVSPLLAFTPLGPLGAGALGALGEAAEKGSNLGDILKSGASNAAIGAGAHSLYGGIKGALGAANGVQSAAGSVAPSNGLMAGAQAAAPPPPVSVGGISMAAPQAASLPASPGWAQSLASSAAPQGASASSKLLSGLKGVGNFAKDNATVLGQTASGVLNARENSQQLDFQKQQYNDQQARQARIAAILGPLYQQLIQQRQTGAPNPYSSNPYTSPAVGRTGGP